MTAVVSATLPATCRRYIQCVMVFPDRATDDDGGGGQQCCKPPIAQWMAVAPCAESEPHVVAVHDCRIMLANIIAVTFRWAKVGLET